MYKLLIADRDKEELSGVKWLISKYSFPVEKIETASHVGEVIDQLENINPDILCIELDMISEDKWSMLKRHIEKYAKQVIAITAESTFERARQALTTGAIDLWVKPFSPSQLKKTLQSAFRYKNKYASSFYTVKENYDTFYEELFQDTRVPFVSPVHMFKVEDAKGLDTLRAFTKQFDFYVEPVVLSTSDRLVFVFKDSFKDQFHQAQRFLREWGEVSDNPLAIAIHEEGKEESLNTIYRKLNKMMEEIFFTGYNQVFHAKHSLPWASIDPFLTTEEQRKWIFMLGEQESNDIKKWLYQDFFALEAPYPDPGMLRTRLTSILAQIRRFMIRTGLNNSETAYDKVFRSILYSSVLYRIVQDIILFLNLLFREVNEQALHIDIIESAIIYMEENFYKNTLTLTEVSDYVDRSPSYLSQLISEKYHQTFSELLLHIRMEQAKEELRTTDQSIQEIAYNTGFNDSNYFSKVFKKFTGRPPRNWRLK